MNSIIKYSYFENNKWIECLRQEWELKSNFLVIGISDINLFKITEIFADNICRSWHYFCEKAYYRILHRLDGPAFNCDKTGNSKWYIYGEHLNNFEKYFSKNNMNESLFEYAKDYPSYYKQLAILAQYHLNDDLFLIFKTMQVFL